MRACKATTKDGTPCQAPPLKDGPYCYHHEPSIATERRAQKRRAALTMHHGGAGKKNRPKVDIQSVADVLDLLSTAASDLKSRKPSVQRARAIAYVSTAALKALEVGELEERLAKLEETLAARRGPRAVS